MSKRKAGYMKLCECVDNMERQVMRPAHLTRGLTPQCSGRRRWHAAMPVWNSGTIFPVCGPTCRPLSRLLTDSICPASRPGVTPRPGPWCSGSGCTNQHVAGGSSCFVRVMNIKHETQRGVPSLAPTSNEQTVDCRKQTSDRVSTAASLSLQLFNCNASYSQCGLCLC